MRIGFIGAGKVGFTLGKYLEQNLKKEKILKYVSPDDDTVLAAKTLGISFGD